MCNITTDYQRRAGEKLRIAYLHISSQEREDIAALLSAIFRDQLHLVLDAFLPEAVLWGQELPRRIRATLYDFKLNETSEAVCVRGFPVDDREIGPTPLAYRAVGQIETVGRPEAFHLLCATILGEPFTWTSIQNGYLLNDVMPLRESRSIVSSSGSASAFDLHTEDAFHPCAGDYLGLMCLRNPDSVGTVLSRVLPGDLSDDNVSLLLEARYVVGANVAQEVPPVHNTSPVFFGNKASPYMRVNLNNTRAQAGDPEADEAFNQLRQVLARNSTPVVFEAGDCWYIDNLRVAHGRWPFTARFDGTDRWLKRLYISSSFRYSALYRVAPSSRILKPSA